MSLRAVIVVIGLCLAPAAQSSPGEMPVVVVDGRMRAGADFATLEEGLDAVADRGTIYLYQPGGLQLDTFVIDRPMTIIGIEDITSISTPVLPGLVAAVEVVGLPAGETVILRNLSLSRGRCFLGCPPWTAGLNVHDCAGRVVIDNVHCAGNPWPGVRNEFKRCAHVHLRNCTLAPGSYAIPVENSNVIFEDCLVYTTVPTSFGHLPPSVAMSIGPGADVTLLSTTVVGELAAYVQSALVMAGGICRVDANSALLSSPIGALVKGAGGPASGTLWLDPGATLQYSGPQPTGRAVSWVPVIQAPVRAVDVDTSGVLPYAGGTYDARLRGDPAVDVIGAIVASPVDVQPFPQLHPSIGTGPDPDYPLAWLDPNASTVLYLGPPTGRATASLAGVPPWSAQVLQGVLFGSDNVIRLTPPFTLLATDVPPELR